MLSLISLICLSLSALLLSWSIARVRRPHGGRLPPSPPGLPLAGNAFQLPSSFLFYKLCEWHKQLGEIYTFSAFGERVVVLGSASTAGDILDRMSSVTSGRPTYGMGALVTKGFSMPQAPYGDRLRRFRRIALENLNTRSIVSYQSVHARGAAELVQALASGQSDLRTVVNTFTGTSVWRALYGNTMSDLEERLTRIGSYAALIFKVMLPTGSLLNIFPALKHIPAPFNPWTQYGERTFNDMSQFGLGCVREGLSGEKDTTFVASCMKHREGTTDLTDVELGWLTMNLLAAGVETTSYTLQFFFLAMVLFPDTAKKAQELIDSVVGDHPPTFKDREQLMYVEALIKELFRWRPVSPLGGPRLATEDIAYRGYLIPKGTVVMANVWNISQNPEAFPEPDVFRPERFLNPDGSLKALDADYHDGLILFGYGRRACVGRDFARSELFISISYLLWSFDFCKSVDENGEEITPSATEFDGGDIVIYPKPFPYVLKPRRDLSDAFSVTA